MFPAYSMSLFFGLARFRHFAKTAYINTVLNVDMDLEDYVKTMSFSFLNACTTSYESINVREYMPS